MLWDICGEILFELILEGAVAGAASRKVPLIVRILLLGAIIFVYGGLIYIIFHLAVTEKSIVAAVCGVFVALLVAMAVLKKYREYKDRKAGQAYE